MAPWLLCISSAGLVPFPSPLYSFQAGITHSLTFFFGCPWSGTTASGHTQGALAHVVRELPNRCSQEGGNN